MSSGRELCDVRCATRESTDKRLEPKPDFIIVDAKRPACSFCIQSTLFTNILAYVMLRHYSAAAFIDAVKSLCLAAFLSFGVLALI